MNPAKRVLSDIERARRKRGTLSVKPQHANTVNVELQMLAEKAAQGEHADVAAFGKRLAELRPVWLYDFLDQRNVERCMQRFGVPSMRRLIGERD